jgi:hypothetical protein
MGEKDNRGSEWAKKTTVPGSSMTILFHRSWVAAHQNEKLLRKPSRAVAHQQTMKMRV